MDRSLQTPANAHTAPASNSPPAASRSRATRALDSLTSHDLWIVVAASVATFALASWFELHEFVAGWAAPFERWQLDELPITALVLVLGLAACAVRGKRAALTELLRRTDAEAEGLRLLASNRELSRQLMAVQENERRALARELHDELGQHCSAIRIEAACMQHAHDMGEMAAAAARTAASADALYASVRSLLRRLRPAELDELGLLAALQSLCEAWETRSGVACMLHHDGPLQDLGEQVDTVLYRVAQEALTNVMRHANASRVWVDLQCLAHGELRLLIADDGSGFDARQRTRGLGLLGAAERAAALGGRLAVDSAHGAGTRVQLSVPHPVPRMPPTAIPTASP
jgi:signal transduction histidine kinase